MNNNTNLFKGLLVVQALALMVYTAVTFFTSGPDLLSVFVGNILSVNWSGQFNLDFLCYLMLSALWIMWRNRFSGRSIVLGLAAMVLGIVLFAPYVLWLTIRENGDIKRVLTGDR